MIVQYLVPYVASLTISFGVGLYAWQQRHLMGAAAFAAVSWAQALWTFGYIFELASTTLAGKIFWDDFQWIGAAIWPIALLLFALQYTNYYSGYHRRTISAAALPFVVFLILVSTNRFHHLIRAEATLIAGVPFAELHYDFTIVVWMMFMWGVLITVFSLALLIARYVRAHKLYRRQIGVIVLGAMIPLIGAALTMMGVTLTFHRDTTPLTFAISNLCVGWGLFHYRLFDVVPVVRDKIFEDMVDMVIVLDAHNRVVDMNPAAAQTIGAAPHTLIGKAAEDIYTQWPDLVKQLDGIEQIQSEITVEAKEPHCFDLRITSLRDRLGRPQGRLIVARDITARKQAEEDLRVINEQLQKLGRVKDEFTANVSHALGSPIASIKVYLAILEKRQEQAPDASLAALKREVARLEDLISGLLQLARMDQDQVQLEFTTISLNQLVSQYVSDRRPLAQSKDLTLAFQPASSQENILGDRRLLGQVIGILLTNAFNYTPAGGQIVVSTEVRQQDQQLWCGFCVQDNGPGIQPDEIPRLFERFFRGQVGRASSASGTGLGLAIAQEIIQRHRGKIEVASNGTAGGGALFSVWLPAEESG
jgi:PAS domain S-box-containing protein